MYIYIYIHTYIYAYVCICIHSDVRKYSIFSQLVFVFLLLFLFPPTAEEVRISQEVNSKYCLRTFEFVVICFSS